VCAEAKSVILYLRLGERKRERRERKERKSEALEQQIAG